LAGPTSATARILESLAKGVRRKSPWGSPMRAQRHYPSPPSGGKARAQAPPKVLPSPSQPPVDEAAWAALSWPGILVGFVVGVCAGWAGVLQLVQQPLRPSAAFRRHLLGEMSAVKAWRLEGSRSGPEASHAASKQAARAWARTRKRWQVKKRT
jgi:hypothetical protein